MANSALSVANTDFASIKASLKTFLTSKQTLTNIKGPLKAP